MVWKISIITVCRNEVEGIRRTLESVKNQRYRNFEHIVIDGGSSDGTKEIIDEFAHSLAHFTSELDNGIYAAQNKGIEAATGDYVLFINGGDAIHDENVLQDVFSTKREADIIYGNLLIEEQDGSETLGRTPPEITLDFLLRGTLWHPVTFIKKTLFAELGFYNEQLKIVADYEFFIRALMLQGASSEHVERVISKFDTSGIGSDPDMLDLHMKERLEVQKKIFTQPVLRMFEELEKFRLHNEFLAEQIRSMDFELAARKNVFSNLKNRLRRVSQNIAKLFFNDK